MKPVSLTGWTYRPRLLSVLSQCFPSILWIYKPEGNSGNFYCKRNLTAKEIWLQTEQEGGNKVRHSACNSIHCVLVYAWKTRSISWVSRFLKSLTLAPNKCLLFFNKIWHFTCSTCSKSSLYLTIRHHPPSLLTWRVYFLLESNYRTNARLQKVFLQQQHLSPWQVSSSGNFIGSTKMARGPVRAQLPTSPQVAYEALPKCLKKKQAWTHPSRVEDRQSSTLI